MTDARSLLERIVLPIADLMERCIPSGLDEGLARWAALHGWKDPVDTVVVARQAALNLVLRALICHCLSSEALPDRPPAFLLLTRSGDLLRDAGLRVCPLSYLDELSVQAEATVEMSEIASLAAALRREREDVIGGAYASWVSQNARRPLGQFWTPWPIAQLMTRWAVQSPKDRVLDPAFGSGVFLLTAIERLTHLGASTASIPHQVAGVELSPLAFLMGLANVLLREQGIYPLLHWGDFLIPEREPQTVLKELRMTYTVGARQITLPGLEIVTATTFHGPFDAIICNPPYTRHHHLPEAYKSSWAMVMKREYGLRLSRFSSLFAYFFVQATRMLAPTGRMAFITPASVFEASYSRQIKDFILRQLHLHALITFDETLSVFEGVDTAACVTLLEGPTTPARERVVHVQIREWPGVETVLQGIVQGDTVVADWGTIREILPSELGPRRKWTVIGHKDSRFDDKRFIPLADIAHIVRGIATGANDFFVLSDGEVTKWGLDWKNLRPVLTKTREAPGYIFNQDDFARLGREGKKRWLLYLTRPVVPGTPEAHYIEHGEARGLHRRSLVKTRRLWYAMEQREPAPIYFTYLSRRRSRFIYNQAGVLALNVFLCIYPIPDICQDETALKALLAVLNSLIARDSLRYVGRTYGGDTIKIEPREMDMVPVLNPLELSRDVQVKLARQFDLLCNASSEEAENVIRQAIDQMIATLRR
ncbi:MAG TPA: hypothetical protein EYP49_07490 [Anaerolineae bacterium]|nr:hypothetical protein [Anaerolineae bacterium]